MADLVAIKPARTAVAQTWAAASAGGDKFITTGKEKIIVRHTNGAGSSVTLTVTSTQLIDGTLTVADRTIVIGAGETHYLGAWPVSTYGDSGDANKVSLGWSSETDIELLILD